MKSPQKDTNLRKEIVRILQEYWPTSILGDKLEQLILQREQEAYLKGIQDANKREMQRMLARKKKEVQND